MSPKTKEQYQEIRSRSMAMIKEVALELFAHNGYHSTSISQITKEAGISKGLIYNYFSGKEDLLNAIIMDAVNLAEELLEKHLTETTDPKVQLRGLTEVSFEMVKKNLHYWKLLTSLAFQTDVLSHQEDFLKAKQEMAIAKFVGIFEGLGVADPQKEAYFYGAVMDGIMINYMQMTDNYPLDEMKEFVLKRYNLIK